MPRRPDLKKLKEYIVPQELPYPLGLIAEITSLDIALVIYDEFKSLSLYIPENSLNRAKERYIADHFSGNNIPEIARITGFSERHIWRLVNKKVRTLKQISLSEMIGSDQ